MDPDEDSITLSMDEYAKLQNDMLSLKHENTHLKEACEKSSELSSQLISAHEEIVHLKGLLQSDPLKKFPKFSREMILSCLKSVRKNEDLDKDQALLTEQILAIVEYIWPKNGEIDLKVSDLTDTNFQIESKILKEANQKMKFSIEAMEEKLKVMQISLEETAKENLKMSQKIAELETQKEHLILDLASREEELGEARKNLKDKFAIECSKQDLEHENFNLKSSLEALKNDLQKRESPTVNAERVKVLESTIEELKNNENLLNLEYSSLKHSAIQTMQELSQTKSLVKEHELNIKQLEDQLKKNANELEDLKTERQIIQKRSMHNIKDLKAELVNEKNLHEQCKMDKEKVIQENRKLHESLRAGVKIAPPSHQEKVLVESMSHKIGELEHENLMLKQKLKEIEDLRKNSEAVFQENEELKNEINKLQLDIAMIGAQFNEYVRNLNLINK